ncbi:MAG: 30S ribosomal protein S1 [Candidatus Tectomicrobia bacterium]|uniref:Small ribosomal subunit protein bS1 n=1 Tax=Tectimicrobiota bacterium TaxID=2528274 RepID=A0A932MN66_UNCTE|nr:30S ribosomal protein S1 [Candidatus Tectomicrobia bacterium]
MEELYASTLQVKDGEIVKGRVVGFEGDYILVDVGYKSEGLVPRNEFPDGGRKLQPGDEVEVYVEEREDEDGLIALSKEKANRIKVWDEISKAYDNGQTVSGEVVARIKGGLTVDIGLKAFLPGSQVDLRPVRNLDQFIGKRFDLKIIKLNRKRGNIVLSRRVLLEDERAELKRETLSKLHEGQQIVGVVKNITDYGAFIDLGGIDGLLHITDMSWGRVSHPSELLSIGDTVKVVVLKYDRERERVSLGHKQITPDPWEDVEIKYPPTGRVKGRVVSITDYGAFIELEQGVEGLVHVSEMSWTRRVRHPSKIVQVGDIVEAVVLNLDKEARRISLGMKQIEANPWTTVEEKYPVGTRVQGKVRNLTEFGAFVALDEGIDGLIHISDISWSQRFKHPSEILRKGQEVEAVVLSVDVDKERLSLGMKQLAQDPWTEIEKRYEVGDDVEAKITKITNFGVFAAPEDDLEGLVHISELSTHKVSKPEEVVHVGDTFKMRVIKIEPDQRRLGLSIRAYVEATGDDPIVSRAPEPAPSDVPAPEDPSAAEEEEGGGR